MALNVRRLITGLPSLGTLGSTCTPAHLPLLPHLRTTLVGHMDGTAVGLRGRAQEQWVNHVREDLHFAGLSLNWWRRSKDRAAWRAAIECLL